MRQPEEGEYQANVAAKLDAVRRHRAVSQATIAAVLGATEATVSRWMTGKQLAGLWDLYRLSVTLDVPLAVLVDPDDGPNDAVLAAISVDRARRLDETERGSGAGSTPASPSDEARAPADRTRRP